MELVHSKLFCPGCGMKGMIYDRQWRLNTYPSCFHVSCEKCLYVILIDYHKAETEIDYVEVP